MNVKIKMATTMFCICFSLSLFSQDLIYEPKNPAFGGNYLNYSWLLNSANAQNTFEAPDDSQEDLLANFEDSFNQQFLSQLTRELISQGDVFGEDGLKPGTFEIGNLVLDIVPGLNGLVITINDIVNGGQTQITVPYD